MKLVNPNVKYRTSYLDLVAAAKKKWRYKRNG